MKSKNIKSDIRIFKQIYKNNNKFNISKHKARQPIIY